MILERAVSVRTPVEGQKIFVGIVICKTSDERHPPVRTVIGTAIGEVGSGVLERPESFVGMQKIPSAHADPFIFRNVYGLSRHDGETVLLYLL